MHLQKIYLSRIRSAPRTHVNFKCWFSMTFCLKEQKFQNQPVQSSSIFKVLHQKRTASTRTYLQLSTSFLFFSFFFPAYIYHSVSKNQHLLWTLTWANVLESAYRSDGDSYVSSEEEPQRHRGWKYILYPLQFRVTPKSKFSSTDFSWNIESTENSVIPNAIRSPGKTVWQRHYLWIRDGDSISTCLGLPYYCIRQPFAFRFYLHFTVGNSKNTFLFREEGKDKFSYFYDSFRHNSSGSHSNIQNKKGRHYWLMFQVILMQCDIILQSVEHSEVSLLLFYKPFIQDFQRSEKTVQRD